MNLLRLTAVFQTTRTFNMFYLHLVSLLLLELLLSLLLVVPFVSSMFYPVWRSRGKRPTGDPVSPLEEFGIIASYVFCLSFQK
jgi:hypothetical protein